MKLRILLILGALISFPRFVAAQGLPPGVAIYDPKGTHGANVTAGGKVEVTCDNCSGGGGGSGGLTDTELRATPVPVSGPVTDTQLRATPVPVSGPLTDTQLRATPLPVSGTTTANQGSAAAAGSGWPVKFDLPATSALTSAAINFNSSGDNTVISATASQTTRVFRMFFVCDAPTVITVKNGATGLTGAFNLVASGAVGFPLDGQPHFVTSANTAFVLSQSGTAQCSGKVDYVKS